MCYEYEYWELLRLAEQARREKERGDKRAHEKKSATPGKPDKPEGDRTQPKPVPA